MKKIIKITVAVICNFTVICNIYDENMMRGYRLSNSLCTHQNHDTDPCFWELTILGS